MGEVLSLLGTLEEDCRGPGHSLVLGLVHHGQGFYYFKGGDYLSSQRLRAVTLFALILFQELEDKKFKEAERAWERNLLMRTFRVDELPHFSTTQRRSMLFTLGVTEETLPEKVLRPMARMGMLEMIGPERFRFRSPIFRLLELCIKFADEDWQQPPNATSKEVVSSQRASSDDDPSELDEYQDEEVEDVP